MTETGPEQKSKTEFKSENNSNKFSFEEFFQHINKWLKLIGPSLVVVATILAAIGTIYAAFAHIDNAIERKFLDPSFLKEVALKTMLPFVIFNENEHMLYSSPQIFYDEYVKDISVNRDDNGSIQEIVFSPKKFLNFPPILECLDANIEFNDAVRINKIDWVYRSKNMKHLYLLSTEKEGDPSVKRFKITVIQ